tara:strand:+ start:1885 stop:2325 length:441 start_codon:yes stop_codon:yes gene_type:complete
VYYKIDLSNYEPRETRTYLEFDEYKFSTYQLETIEKELNNFQDSFGRPWKEWDTSDLKDRLQNNFTFYLLEGGWCFIDWDKKYPYLCNRYVFPEHRGKGLGKDLVWLRCNEIKKRGLNTASIKLDWWNTPALSVKKDYIFTEIDGI